MNQTVFKAQYPNGHAVQVVRWASRQHWADGVIETNTGSSLSIRLTNGELVNVHRSIVPRDVRLIVSEVADV